MPVPEYDFVLPSSGIALKWKPLPVRVSLQIGTQFPNASQNGQRQASLLGARVCMFNGTPKPGGLSYGEITSWDDELDLDAFAEDVAEKEAIRSMVLRKKGAGATVGARQAFGEALEEIQASANRMQVGISAMLHAAEAMKSEFDPLGSQPSST